MAHTRVSSKESDQIGRQLYNQRIRALVEMEENIGRFFLRLPINYLPIGSSISHSE